MTEKPHRELLPYCGIAFWNGNAAADRDTATRAVVYCGPPGMPYPEFEFKLPEQTYELDQMCRALGKAYDRGVYAAKQEIRDVLGVIER